MISPPRNPIPTDCDSICNFDQIYKKLTMKRNACLTETRLEQPRDPGRIGGQQRLRWGLTADAESPTRRKPLLSPSFWEVTWADEKAGHQMTGWAWPIKQLLGTTSRRQFIGQAVACISPLWAAFASLSVYQTDMIDALLASFYPRDCLSPFLLTNKLQKCRISHEEK